MKHNDWFAPVILLSFIFAAHATVADEVSLMQSPVKVTATVHSLEEGGITAQFAIHNGPLAQVVDTTLNGVPLSQAENALRHQLKWQAPYLLVHASCNINSVRHCGGDVVFKVSGSKVIRMGDFVETGSPVFSKGRFFDGYDKLGEQIDFTIVLTDVNDELEVNADATWTRNADNWLTRSNFITSTMTSHNWGAAEWNQYLDAIINNAALARYCNRTEALQLLLDNVNSTLNIEQRKLLTDALSKVVPLEKPKMWRKAY